METKICSCCKEELTLDRFDKNKNSKDGLRTMCKKCRKVQNKKYREEHLVETKIYNDKYAGAHRDIIKEQNKKYRENHLDIIKIKSKIFREENPQRIYAYQKKYYIKNREKINIKNQKRNAKKLLLPSTFTIEQWEQVKLYFDNKCCYCGKELPLQQEHFIPVNSSGGYTRENIICACKSCNSSKSDINFFEWYPAHKFYNKEREDKILKYINNNLQEPLNNITKEVLF